MAKAHLGQAIDTACRAPQVLFPLLFDRAIQLEAFHQQFSSGPTRARNRPRVVYVSGPIGELPIMLVRRLALVVLPNQVASSTHQAVPGQLLHCVWPNAELELRVRTDALWRQVCASVYGLRQWRSTYSQRRFKDTEHVTTTELAMHFERGSFLPSFVLPIDGAIPDQRQRETLGRLFEKLARLPDVAGGRAPTIFITGSGNSRIDHRVIDRHKDQEPARKIPVNEPVLSVSALSDFESDAVQIISLPGLEAPGVGDIGEWVRSLRGLAAAMNLRVDWPRVSDTVERRLRDQGAADLSMRAVFPVLVRTINECVEVCDRKGTGE